MNWYKIAYTPEPISIVSYNSYNELGISFNGGKKYIYPNVSPFFYEKIKKLLKRKNYSTVAKILKSFAVNKEIKEEKPLPITSNPPPPPKQQTFDFMN